jgi:hypothetical protein
MVNKKIKEIIKYNSSPWISPTMSSLSENGYTISENPVSYLSGDAEVYQLIGQRFGGSYGRGWYNGWSIDYTIPRAVILTKLTFYNGKYLHNTGNYVEKIEFLVNDIIVATVYPTPAENTTSIIDLSYFSGLKNIDSFKVRFNQGISGEYKYYSMVKGMIFEGIIL